MTGTKSGRKKVALLLVGMVLGAALITPAGAHVTSVKHSWKKHFLPLAKKVFYTKKQSNAKFITRVAPAGKANDLTRVAHESALCPTVTTTEVTCATLSITAPKVGYVAVSAVGSFTSSDCTSACDIAARISHVESVTSSNYQYGSLNPSTSSWTAVTPQATFPVEKGVNTFLYVAGRNFGNGTIVAASSLDMTASFSLFNQTGAAAPAPLGVRRTNQGPFER